MSSPVIWRVLLQDGRLWLVWASGLASRPAAWAAIWLGGSHGPYLQELAWLQEAREGRVGDSTVPAGRATSTCLRALQPSG